MNDDTSTPATPSPARRAPRAVLSAVAAVGAAVLGVTLLTGCGTQQSGPSDSANSASVTDGPSAAGSGWAKPSQVLWMGDSVAKGEAPPLTAALKAAGVAVTSMASDGGGGVSGPAPLTESTWKELDKQLEAVRPQLVAYQITTYDWGTESEQKEAYEKLVTTVKAAGARLVLVTAPPFDVDSDFYAKSKDQIATAPKAARAAAEAHPGDAVFLDAADLWGSDFKDERAYRASDKIHSCQQGTARFAQWFTTELGKLTGFSPADAKGWTGGEWTKSDEYAKLNCS
ncbi:SGNH/GDSL hydrolase family protein [Streptomyces sp. IBSNAI002]|uniref:SGNH/GDSL hydrolase family protein n=1 Tax=Streptomyces sp. IBSNAI002 TaxID=3457500 RepID=UPI003FD09084